MDFISQDDYEFRNRLNNIMWTISQNYDEELENLDKYAKISKDLAIYFAVKSGARKKYLDWEMIKKFIYTELRKGTKKEILIPLIEMCADIMVEDKLLAERPAIEEIRNIGFEKMLMSFLNTRTRDLMEQLRYALVFDQMGKSVSFDSKVLSILKDIKKCKDAESTKDLLKMVIYIIKKHFENYSADREIHFEELEEKSTLEILEQDSDFADFMYEELYDNGEVYKDISDIVDNIQGSLLIESLGDMSKERESREDRVIYVDPKTAKKIYDKISYYYGESFISERENQAIERKVCKNIHHGCRLHFTDGVLRTENDNSFQKKFVSRQKENNISYYSENPRVHRRNINKLKQMIMRTMIQESEVSKIPSDYGLIVPNKLWRIGRSSNTKVFNKIINNEKGGFVVDILLDASGSQRANQGKVATQAYIISEALTQAGIPNRVMGFNSFLDYTILRRYRDYDSGSSANKNIFEYYSAGNNRDGLAIQAVCYGLLQREEENKILIVLSDGKPNDIKISKSQVKIIGQKPYKGAIAIRDTALEVRRARKQGILVLGVFTGREEELYAEKYIYGKDFVYTRNVDRFADIVGTFLKRVIENY